MNINAGAITRSSIKPRDIWFPLALRAIRRNCVNSLSVNSGIAAEVDGARAELAKAEAADSPYQSMLETALSYIRDARSGYANADPYVKRLWNRTLIERIEIKGGQVAGVELKQPFAGLFLLASSNKGTLVGGAGFEPGASRS
jgi:hypothetical protein